MEAFLVSTGLVALAEIGDKTQLLALVLAARYRKPVPIIFGILIATLLNHAVAAAAGVWVTELLEPKTLRWVLGISFIAMGAWMLIPDKFEEQQVKEPRFGIFATTLLAFFILEIGDKTQVATVALAANYDALLAVVLGTTFGMMIANVPAVLLGELAAKHFNVRLLQSLAAIAFVVLGVAVLFLT
jgi:putative Ca2+/H+ antiporter (TMEM165/GDT1 family)